MNISHISTSNWQNALRGMRNPKDSWDKSESVFGLGVTNEFAGVVAREMPWLEFKDWCVREDNGYCEIAALCKNDIYLGQTLIKGGPVHSKFLRQIFISMDITAPLYLWKELDTYKVATTANSCSTMHTIHTKEIDMGMFEIDDYTYDICGDMVEYTLIPVLENLRLNYLEYKNKSFNEEDPEKASALMKTANTYWKELIRWLPEGWLQTRTWTANYETARNILAWRDPHKLTEWEPICNALKSLPYADYFLTMKKKITK